MLVVGLMSGTSLDGMDAAILRCKSTAEAEVGTALSGLSIAFEKYEREILSRAVDDALRWQFSGPEPSSFEPAATMLAQVAVKAVTTVLQKNRVKGRDLHAIGFHGQTLLHVPPVGKSIGKTLQIGNAQILADTFDCKVVHDFRSADMKAGGHGAPLAPAWHFELAKKTERLPFVFVNIGGVSNITFVPTVSGTGAHEKMVAFDCGPGNGPLDALMQFHNLGQMDTDGALAAKGNVQQAVVSQALSHLPAVGAAMSVDRWAFDHTIVEGLSVVDGAATLVEITAQAIVRGLSSLSAQPKQILVGGGGRLNPVLMHRLRELSAVDVMTCERAGFNGDLIEAEAFAWLTALRLAEQPTSWPGTTGATRPVVGGIICEPSGLF